MKKIIYIAFLILIVSCGTSKKINKQYLGKPVNFLIKEIGAPKTILQQNGQQVYVYETVKDLNSTEVSQGKLTLDPIVSPKVKKTERYYFTVKDSVIINTKYEEDYKR